MSFLCLLYVFTRKQHAAVMEDESESLNLAEEKYSPIDNDTANLEASDRGELCAEVKDLSYYDLTDIITVRRALSGLNDIEIYGYFTLFSRIKIQCLRKKLSKLVKQRYYHISCRGLEKRVACSRWNL